jgi:methionine aminopeptidase
MAMIKQPHEIALMAESGRLLAQVFAALDQLPLQGRSTMEINEFVERMIVDELQARPASKGQYGFPYVLNTSIDDVICHGVPSTTDVLRNGQIVNLDITLETPRAGWCRPPTRRCGKASAQCAPAHTWAISATPSPATRAATATAW